MDIALAPPHRKQAVPALACQAELELLRQCLAPSQAGPGFAEVLFDCASDTMFFVKNRQAQYVAVNQALVTRFGARSKADLLGRTVLDLFPAAHGREYYTQDRRVLDHGEEIRDRLQLVPGREGGWNWSLSYKFPLSDARGEVVGLCGICKDVSTPEADVPDPQRDPLARVAQVIEQLQQRHSEPLRIEELTRAAGLSLRCLERQTKRLFGHTPLQLLARSRLAAARRLLIRSQLSIAEIASACGYSDQSAFTRQFRAATGMPPTGYRAIMRAEA